MQTDCGRPLLLVLISICLLLLLPGCAQTPTPTVALIRLAAMADDGTTPLMQELVTAYIRERPAVTIGLHNGANAERTLAALEAGEVDLVAVSWLPDRVKVNGELWYDSFARDAIVLIVHHSNTLPGLALSDLRNIYRGQTLSWADVGGMPVDVVPVVREEGAGTRHGFDSIVMGQREVTPTALILPDEAAVVQYVAATPGAIGYVSPVWLSSAVNVLAVEGVIPSPQAVEDGRYLLARASFLIARANPGGGPAAFIDWVMGEEGQAMVKRAYAPAP
jgi:phosphate transport system substrate-binding protein